ncbi:MAG: hypothetical protein K2O11_11580 [Oscillospiraceae bacterium]|nr:hypothetical protein [Oscillospiraceae bacterium]
MELAVGTAKQHAADTEKPVTVMAHTEGGGSQEAIFNPDGTNDKIWNIDKGRPLIPSFGQVYLNRGGGEYRCISRTPMTGTTYYNASGGSSSTAAVFQNVKSGWTFTAKGIIQYIDGTIEWDHSSDGHFAGKKEDPTWAGRRHE